ncbi:2-C-methyl-D-erythritol 4-phosphate cytidylyltransferase [Bowmanella dokdonensis]|nr:2-C-methyl-D-erythritol 4-phosphate cytidylyltransferase [Bowmanella dokdonensis]
MVEGNPCNIKVTQPIDLMLAEFYLSKLLKNGRSFL